jgi:plastocyanin
MVRAGRLIAAVALLGVLAVLAFPADGWALRAVGIALTPTGPSPAVLNIPAGMYPYWFNNDSVTHTVTFTDGSCSFQVTPGDVGQCPGFHGFVGTFPYVVDGTVQASVVVVAEGRAVYLHAGSHRIERGAGLTLHGELDIPILSPPGPPAPQPVVVLARRDRYHPFHRIRVVTATAHGWHLQWQLHVRPRTRTIYIAEANFQPSGGQYWDRAWSESFRVAVRPR